MDHLYIDIIIFSGLTALTTPTINPTTLSCAFEGTNKPTFLWSVEDDAIAEDSSIYGIEVGDWTELAQTSTLTITDLVETGTRTISCVISFADIDDYTLSTATEVIVRGRILLSKDIRL